MDYFGTESQPSTLNYTTTPLGAGETYTGTGEWNKFNHVVVSGKADADGRLYFDFSIDGVNWDSTFPSSGFLITAGQNFFQPAVKVGWRYFRFRIVNGSSAQTYVRARAYYSNNYVPAVSPLNQTAGLDQGAIFTRSTVPQDEIRIGRRAGVEGWTKFAYRTTLQAASGEQTVWAATGNFTPMTTASTFTIAYDGTGGGSTDGSGTTGATQLTIYYIDSDGLPAIGVHTLGTDGSDVTSFSGLGINRVAVSANGGDTYNASDITITETTGGTTQAFIPSQQSVTQQAIFFVGSNHDCIAKFLYFNVNKLSGSNPKVTVKAYVYNRSVNGRYEVFRHIIDTQSETTLIIKDPIGFNLSPTDVLYFVADTDQNNTVITLRFSLNQYQRI